MLTVYVDDFKLAGPTASLKEGWDLISSQMDVGVPGGLGLYLGCKQDHQDHRGWQSRHGHRMEHGGLLFCHRERLLESGF